MRTGRAVFAGLAALALALTGCAGGKAREDLDREELSSAAAEGRASQSAEEPPSGDETPTDQESPTGEETPTEPVTTPVSASSILYWQLRAGHCFNSEDVSGDAIIEITLIDCDEPHDMQIIATHEMDTEEYPGLDVVTEEAISWCLEEFDAYPYAVDASEFTPYYLVPTQPDFDNLGAHTYFCAIIASEPITGTV